MLEAEETGAEGERRTEAERGVYIYLYKNTEEWYSDRICRREVERDEVVKWGKRISCLTLGEKIN